jgi:UDP-N-acetylmuramoyl-tripeptide--D-alanyl-D-alanine ligase
MELETTPSGVVVLNDAYNANPASMEAALRALAHIPVGGRRIAVLGDMRELGEHAEGAYRSIGALVAQLGIDVVVGVGEGSAIAHAAPGVDAIVVRDAHEARDEVMKLVGSGDAVLVKASRAVGLEIVAESMLDAS